MKRLSVLFVLIAATAAAQDAAPWRARWISVPDSPVQEYGVYHFRRTFEVAAKPASFPVRVTADNRYVLYVNGERVGFGPARGDLNHWRYETYDIAPQLKAGKNVLAALVWNAGADGPIAQNTHQTGFLLAGDGVDTGSGWKCIRNEAYKPEPVTREIMPYGYYAAGPGDRVDGSRYPWGWERPDFDDSAWKTPAAGTPGGPRDMRDSPSRWMLIARPIPPMEMTPERLARVRKASEAEVGAGFPAKRAPVRVAARAKATLLLDQNHLTTAFPELTVSGGKGATVTVGYAEALFAPGSSAKGNRDEVEGKRFLGYQDVFIADGGAQRTFRPLWWRTYRYVQLTVETQDEPLTIDDFTGVYTGYPFVKKARFDAGSAELQKILEVGFRTARLCAHESYMDCPYYEQLQYAGDTRIQALVSLYTTGDGRLVRNAIEQLDSSRTPEGATYSRAPSRLQQYIPPFSLWWIGMVHDYWMYQQDPNFVKEMLPGVRSVLAFFAARQNQDGSLGKMPWWNFVDWAKEWRNGVPPVDADGASALLDLQLLLGYQWAARMEEALGYKPLGQQYAADAARLKAAIPARYWDADRRMYADTPSKKQFSQHAQALAVLAGLIEGEAARGLINRAADDKSITQCTIYFRHYLHSALTAAGAGDRYLDMLGEWRAQLGRGMTTWAEMPEPSRSDCHAWGASPNYELFRTVLGIDSAAPGFTKVAVRPFLGKLEKVEGSIPHPQGEIAVRLARKGAGVEASVTLPASVTGEFIWDGQKRTLNPGRNVLTF
ncbi:MAG TPA: family 78 glycoside hydrolase catalytic domain [Bryobacteraceae bacterium]|nr:family 78 glycoside hydrolase catalytic domain [Bryobacteraceae bacterium]